MKKLLLFLIPLALLSGCKEPKTEKTEESSITDKTDTWNKVDEQNGSRPWSGFENEPVSEKNIGFNNPEGAVMDLIKAAKAGDISKVHTICSMKAKSPEFQHSICNIQPGTPEADAFQKRFANARIGEEILINGNFADVPVIYADNDRDMVRLVLVGDQWYVATVKSYNVSK
jgi:hypothetical protein